MEFLFEEIAISSKLELCGANEVDIRNQRFQLRRNTLFLGRKAIGFSRPVPNFFNFI